MSEPDRDDLDPDAPAVELVPAFCWTCEACGQDNFERAIVYDREAIDSGDIPVHESPDFEAAEAWEDAGHAVVWMAGPDRVECAFCRARFPTC